MIAIIGAMDEEVHEFLSHSTVSRTLERRHFRVKEAELFGVPVVIIKCGVGKVFASLITQHIIDQYAPTAVISTGVAGGLSKNLEIGDVVVSRDCIHHDLDARALGCERGQIPYTDFRFFPADENLVGLALSTKLESGHKVVAGRILTGDQFISGDRAQTHAYLIDELYGDAVDMETAAIAQTCFINETPFVSVRTVSDYADGSAHIDFPQFLPVIAKNSFDVVREILMGMEKE